MTGRAAAAGLALLTLSAGPSAACDLAPGARPDGLAAYHQLVAGCLAAPPAPARFDPVAEAEFLARVNLERTSRGLAALAPRSDLLAPARFHSLDQVWNGTYGHDGSAGRSLGDRIAALDRTLVYRSARENVAYAGGDYAPGEVAEMLHNGLMESPGHRANTLDPDITHAGIGVARVHDQFVVTLVFIEEAGLFGDDVPIRSGWAELADTHVELGDWNVRRLALQTADGETLEGPGAAAHQGEARLLVRGEKPASGGRYQFIYLSGPLVEVARGE